MEHFFHRYFFWLHHKAKKTQKYFSHHPFFKSKNIRLVIVILIALAIPLTVLALQQTQDIREFAAQPAGQKCDGVGVIYKADPNPVNSGEFVTFSKTDGTEVTTDTNHFGNGYDQTSCVPGEAPGSLKCKTKSRGSGGAEQYSTWSKFPGGRDVCWYAIVQAPTATRDPNRPASTPRTAPACSGTIKSECTFDNKPRLVLSWDLRGVDAGCTAEVFKGNTKTATQSTRCSNASGVRLEGVENNGTYSLILNNGTASCTTKNAGAVTTNCGGTRNGTPPTTPPAGTQPSNTPAPGTGTPTVATCKDKTIHLDTNQTSCYQNKYHKISGNWEITGPNCEITLYKNGEPINKSTNCDKSGGWFTSSKDDDIVPGESYQLKATSDVCTDPIVSNPITAKACVPNPTQVPGSFGADDLGYPNATPTFVPPIQP